MFSPAPVNITDRLVDSPCSLPLSSPQCASNRLPAKVRCISSRILLGGERELLIEHEGNQYHLRLTRNDRLILTK